MKRIITVLLLAAGYTTIASGQDDGRSRPCSLASLRGSYGYSFNGTVTPWGPVAGHGTIVFTSAGNLSGSYIESTGGVLFQGKFTGGSGKLKGLTGNGTFKTKMSSPNQVEATWQGAYELASAKAHTHTR